MGGDVNFYSLWSPTINDAGNLAFSASLTGGGFDPINQSSIWSGPPGGLTARVLSGHPAPGTPAGVMFESASEPVIGGAGDIAFRGWLTGPGVTPENARGLWRQKDGVTELVMRAESQAPGTPAGVLFESFNSGLPLINGLGQVAFHAYLSGPGIDGTNNHGIWGMDEDGVVRIIARSGDPLEIAPGDSRTVLDLFVLDGAGGHDGRTTALADNGDLTFYAVFTDGSGAVLAARVPEPAASLCMLAITLAVPRRSRQRGA
jgi:hypothetical protein